MLENIRVSTGNPFPLGASIQGSSVNFALFSSHADRVTLGLFVPRKKDPEQEFPLHRTGDVWHAALESVPEGVTYAYRLEGVYDPSQGLLYNPNLWLADPYARSIDSPSEWDSAQQRKESPAVRAHIVRPKPFDWQGVSPPKIPDQDIVVYELHVRGFTRHPSSEAAHPGTYSALIEKIPYLKELGVNAIELMPLFEFDETHSKNIDPETGTPLPNYWGYNPLHYFVPMKRYAASDPVVEFKTLVRELHRAGIALFLDVVFNHSGEGKEKDYYAHFRGIDNSVYYMVDSKGEYRDYTGCGNTLNANHPAVQPFILDSLRFWADEMRVDGFRFDLAATWIRDTQGHPIKKPPILDALAQDPLLSTKKLIAEAWDAAGLYLVGDFHTWNIPHEWNGVYRDQVRRFLKGTDGAAGLFASALSGSEPTYRDFKTPTASINFVTAHDGYSLRDLVSYQEKHNLANGDKNLDGSDQNENWNCGFEGPTKDPEIQALRERQMRNFFLALFTSQGIPMLLMGDEYGHTRKGNNNPYVQDNEINWFLWDELEQRRDIFDYVASLIAFRRRHPELRRTRFLTDQDVSWHGKTPGQADWSSKLVACLFATSPRLYLAFNTDYKSTEIHLPEGAWRRIVDTALPWNDNFLAEPEKAPLVPSIITLAAYSSVLLREASPHTSPKD